MNRFRRHFPILTWGSGYSRRTFANDLIVAGIVTVMLMPQSLGDGLLAGLPAQVGLYASMAPQAVGPVAVASLRTAATVNAIDVDASALESLEAINHRVKDGGILFHLSEVKGAVMDRLKQSHFLHALRGKVHLASSDAVSGVRPHLARRALAAQRRT